MKAHMVFLRQHYASGAFIMSGRKVPRDGGIILVRAENREAVEALMTEDPFCKRGLAEFRVTEFRVSQRAESIPKDWE
jgi:uncharacterized protein YciI